MNRYAKTTLAALAATAVIVAPKAFNLAAAYTARGIETIRDVHNKVKYNPATGLPVGGVDHRNAYH